MALWEPPLSWLLYRIMYPTDVCLPSTSERENADGLACCGASGHDGADQRPEAAFCQRPGLCHRPGTGEPSQSASLLSPVSATHSSKSATTATDDDFTSNASVRANRNVFAS